jgi:hypothetical protein
MAGTGTDSAGTGALWQRADLVWHHAFAVQQLPPRWLVLGGGVLALVVVCSPRVWPAARTMVTIAHEGGHAVAALVTGRHLSGVRVDRGHLVWVRALVLGSSAPPRSRNWRCLGRPTIPAS